MPGDPKITSIEVHTYQTETPDMGTDYNGFNAVYEPGGMLKGTSYVMKINTDQGISGECVGWGAAETATLPMFAHYLIGKSALERELIYKEVKRALRQMARIGLAPTDVCLWDIAGKYHNAPIYKLLGGNKDKKIPCYASTYHGDHQPDGLSSPEAFADFAEQCLEMGYPAFKIHGWGDAPIAQECANVLEMGRRVGDKMDLMLDPACEYETFADAVKVGRACDEAGFYWLEDPFKDGGISQFAHRKLRQLIRTPLLQTEHVRSLEPHVDFILADATDFVRGDVMYDGITGVMKLAHAAEGLGIDIEFHGPGPAQRHCMASIRNTNYYEMGLVHPKLAGGKVAPEVRSSVYKNYDDGLRAIDENGCVQVPDGPGLGVEIDWDFVEKNRVGLIEYK
jgi:L-alanine-DL-glutamate epimerase-like enolase superfamily enzyme